MSPTRVREPIRGLQAFHYRGYRWFWLTAVMTFASVHIQQLGRAYLAQDLTASPFLVTLSFALWSLPILVLPLVSGTLADRIDRRKILVGAEVFNIVLVLAMAVVLLFDGMTVVLLMAFSLFGGAVTGGTLPVRQAMIADLVPRPAVTNGVVHFTVVLNGMMATAPGAAGFILEEGGVEAAFFTALGFSALALLTAARLPSRPPAGDSTATAREAFLEGLRYIRNSHSLTVVISSAALFTVFATAYMALLPIFQRDVLEVGGSELGLLFTSAGIGGLVASLLLAALNVSRPLPGVMIGAGVLQGLVLILFAQSETFALSLGIIVVVGMTQSIFLALNMATVQLLSPSEISGRIFAFRTIIWGVAPFGQLILGGLAEVVGPQTALVAVGAVAAATQVGVWLWTRAAPIRQPGEQAPSPTEAGDA